jgi:NAD(P)H dehydrogenase (quinone)
LHEDEHYSSGNKNITQQNKEFQNKIKKSNKLIFIYPVWWNSSPAILKGFIDRVFTSGFGFFYKNRMPHGLLNGKKAVVFVTSGAPRLFFRLFEKDIAAKQMTEYTLKFCGINSRYWVIGNAMQLNEKQKRKIAKKVGKGLNYLFNK